MFLYDYLWPTSVSEFTSKFSNPLFLVDFCISFVVICVLAFFVFKFVRSKRTAALYLIALVLMFACITLGLLMAAIIIGLFILLSTVVMLIISSAEIKSIMHDDFGWRGTVAIKNNNRTEDVEKLCSTLEGAILDMAKNKCGALITIERNDRITTDRFSRYDDMDCELTANIVKTIFFKGSPLHDGATIIREGRIVRAGVIFDSVSVSGAAMPGSLGSRHRAALGITEAFDCVCITVSEETGSIHICNNGIIRKCYVSNFKETLLEVLTDED